MHVFDLATAHSAGSRGQDQLLALACARLLDHLGLPHGCLEEALQADSDGGAAGAGGCDEDEGRRTKNASLGQALRGLGEADAMRVAGFLSRLREARWERTAALLDKAWGECAQRFRELAQAAVGSSLRLSIGSKQRVSKAAVLAPLQQRLARLDPMAADSPGAASHGDAVGRRGRGVHELLDEAAALRELVVPDYMSAHAVGRLLSKPLMSPPQLVRFDWSGRQVEDGEVLGEEQEAEVPLVLEGADEEVLAALAEHAPSLREVCLRCSGATSAAAMARLLLACWARLHVLSLLGLDSLANPGLRAHWIIQRPNIS